MQSISRSEFYQSESALHGSGRPRLYACHARKSRIDNMTDHSSPKRRRSSRLDLPISIYRDELIKVVDESQVVVIVGETGSGKTTQLPQYLHQDGLEGNGIIAVTQPRRVAAISVAHRVAEELECLVGELVGYQVRFESCLSEETKIKYMTDGCLLREFLVDPHLNKYSIVVLDEAHERSLDTVS